MQLVVQKGAAPIYQQVQSLIRDRIAAGSWQPGDAIPSEQALGMQFGIARMTVRQALDGLIREGLLVRERGRGTFVSRPRIEHELTRMHSFSEDMRNRGMAPAARLLDREVVPAPAEVGEKLGLGLREAVIYLRRLRLANGLPMALEISYLHYDLCRAVLEADLEAGSLYTYLEDAVGLRLTHASQELEAALPDMAEAALLELPRRHPVLVIRQIVYLRGLGEELPAIFGLTVYRADRYHFHMEIPR